MKTLMERQNTSILVMPCPVRYVMAVAMILRHLLTKNCRDFAPCEKNIPQNNLPFRKILQCSKIPISRGDGIGRRTGLKILG